MTIAYFRLDTPVFEQMRENRSGFSASFLIFPLGGEAWFDFDFLAYGMVLYENGAQTEQRSKERGSFDKPSLGFVMELFSYFSFYLFLPQKFVRVCVLYEPSWV